MSQLQFGMRMRRNRFEFIFVVSSTKKKIDVKNLMCHKSNVDLIFDNWQFYYMLFEHTSKQSSNEIPIE